KRAIERLRPQEKRAVQDDAIDGALEDAGIDQADEGLGHHLADAVEALVERAGFRRRSAGREPGHDLAKPRIVPMADDEALRQRVADLADADLQRAAVAYEARGVQADRIFGIRERLRRR